MEAKDKKYYNLKHDVSRTALFFSILRSITRFLVDSEAGVAAKDK